MKEGLISLRILLILSLVTGLMYPLLITLSGQALWSKRALGSLISEDGTVRGSELLAQKFVSPKYFHPRPSAVDYATVPSGASNLSATNAQLQERIAKARAELSPSVPQELLATSASGLDPHLSPEAVAYQVEGVVRARNLSEGERGILNQLIVKHSEWPLLGVIGKRMINVVKLNYALDAALAQK